MMATISNSRIKTRYFLMLFILALSASFKGSAQTYSWSNLPDFIGLERDDAVAFSIDKSIFVGSGNHGGFSESNLFYKFEIDKGTWSSIRAFPGAARQYATIEVVGEIAYLIGGIDLYNNPLNDCWTYNSRTDNWEEVAPFPAEPRWQAISFVLGEFIYYGTGRDWTDFYNDFWRYSPLTDEWDRMADLPENPSYERVAFSLMNKGYVGLGRDCTGVFIPTFSCYNPTEDMWKVLGTFPGQPRYYAAATRLGSKGIVCAGQNEAGTLLADAWVFSPVEERWTEIETNFDTGIRGQAACSLPFFGAFFCTGLNEDFDRVSAVHVIKDIYEYKNFNQLFYNDLINVIYIDGLPKNSVLTVHSIRGDLVVDQRITAEYLSIPTQDWATGVYLVSVNGRTKKIVVN
jgi:N-acetylneuraminic acid mutarotase